MRLFSLIVLAGMGLCTVSWAEPAAAAQQPTTAPATQAAATPINKFCPLNPENEVDPKVTVVYEGKTIGFCCSDCIADFQKDPAKYMKTLK